MAGFGSKGYSDYQNRFGFENARPTHTFREGNIQDYAAANRDATINTDTAEQIHKTRNKNYGSMRDAV